MRSILLACSGFVLSALAQAQPVAPQVHQLPFTLTTSFESLRLPGAERLGLMGVSVLFEPDAGWGFGPTVYGAATGDRGGFFVPGAQLERHWRFKSHNEIAADIFAGGGGGGSAAVGGGLMLKLSLSLSHNFGPVKAGIFASEIDFPNGHIRSHELGVQLSWTGDYHYYDPMWSGEQLTNALRSGFGFDRMALTATRYQLSSSSQVNSSSIDAIGVSADHWLSPHWYAGIDTAGAAHGGADGYAQGLGVLGYEVGLFGQDRPRLSLGADVGLGLGGGGAVKTGGGIIGKVAGKLSLRLTKNYYVSFESGLAAAARGDFHAHYQQLTLGMIFDQPDWLTHRIDSATIQRNEWSFGGEFIHHADRKDGARESLATVGMKLNHYLDDAFYLTGQVQSAFAGHAGAFSMGLLGLGYNTNTDPSGWSAGLEVLGGAAGGGGVYTQGGAVAQGCAWLGMPVDRHSQIRLSLGDLRSLKGGLNSPLVDLSWSHAFGLAGQ